MATVPLPLSPAGSRQPSRQQSVRHLSSIAANGNARLPQISDLFTTLQDVLTEGDVIGAGAELHGEVIESVHIPTSASPSEQLPPADRLKVVRRLELRSYAVVYLVREILAIPPTVRPSWNGHPNDDDDSRSLNRNQFGREFAVKCLSRVSLSPEELEIQLNEAKLHQSLPAHPNIITLHRTLQTPAYLLLVLEYVPGEDLFSFLEQSKDYLSQWQKADSISTPAASLLHQVTGSQSEDHLVSRSSPASNALAPATPSSLSTVPLQPVPPHERFRLIASMVSQMCEAVDACHKHGVSHRNIKPTNFIVTEDVRISGERKVAVKLCDFGLATLQQESSDIDVGSAAYMSYECRNNVAPTYATQPADVWSLGIVIINMLYHHSPWSDTAALATPLSRHNIPGQNTTKHFACASFNAFVASPVEFFKLRFHGMTLPAAQFFARRVFCLDDVSKRLTARELGEWVKHQLPTVLSQDLHQVSFDGSTQIGRRPSKFDGAEVNEESSLESGSRLSLLSLMDRRAPSIMSATTVASAKDEIDAGELTTEADDLLSIRRLSEKRMRKRGARGKHRSPLASPDSLGTSPEEDAHRLGLGGKPVSQTPQSTASSSRRSSASRSTRSKHISSRESALNRLPPMPSVTPPVPPLDAATYDIAEAVAKIPGAAAILQSAPVMGPKSWIPRIRFGGSSPRAAPAAHPSNAWIESPILHPDDFDREQFSLVSRGGYCDVYKCPHSKLGPVALKRLRPKGKVNIPKERELYKREAKLWAPLRHVNILQFYGWLEVDSEIYLVSPWMDHGTLRNFLQEQPRSDRPPFIRDTADGLAYLHEMGIVHGDLKASNILVSPERRAVLCDFGLSRVVDACGTSSDQCAGSAQWMSPEILEGKPRSFSSDIYAFGMTTYEILFGLIPFEMESGVTVIKKVLIENARPSPPVDRPQGLDVRSYEIIWNLTTRCWHVDRQNRPSAKEIVACLLSTAAPIQSRGRSSIASREQLSDNWRQPFTPKPMRSNQTTGRARVTNDALQNRTQREDGLPE